MTVGVNGRADEPTREPHDAWVGHRGLHEFAAPTAPGRPEDEKHGQARLGGPA